MTIYDKKKKYKNSGISTIPKVAQKSKNLQNKILNFDSLYHETDFKLTLLLFKHLIKNMQML